MTELTDLSETDSANTSIGGINIDEGCAPSGMNNAVRNALGLLRRAFKSSIFRLRDATDQTKLLAFDLSGQTAALTRTYKTANFDGAIGVQAKWTDIASAATTNLAAANGDYGDVTGTATITALGTADAGIERTVRFTGILTLTYNATSLKLYSKTNITTYDGLVMRFRSLGSGNWVETSQTVARGTWVPIADFGGASVGLVATTAGLWEKDGDNVTLSWSVIFSNKGSSTGTLSTGILPFIPSAALAAYSGNVSVFNLTSVVAGLNCQVVSGSGGLFYFTPNSTGDTQITNGNVTNSTVIYGNIRYRAAS